MKSGMQICHKQKKLFLTFAAAISATALVVSGFLKLGGQIWADGMTTLWFSNGIFCQRVSQAINDSLGNGMADGSDCANFKLYVSTAAIGNIQTLDIAPPENGFGNINWEVSTMSIDGDWISSFYNLTSLSITDMHLNDISPLSGLSGDLTYLNLINNDISDVSPLLSLRDKLVYLDLSGNPISGGMPELSRFSKLTTLKLVNTELGDFSELFQPPEMEIEYTEGDEPKPKRVYDVLTNETLTTSFDPETSEPRGLPESSKLAKVLQIFDIKDNEDLSSEKQPAEEESEEEPEEGEEKPSGCEGSLASFEAYKKDLAITELYANNDNLNANDLICIAQLNNLEKLDVSNNHIDDFSSIEYKTYSMLKADSQTFTRSVESLDYDPLPAIFTQAGQKNYFALMTSATNEAVSLDDLTLDNAQFNGVKVRFVNAAIASEENENPQPATVTIPAGTGVFENSKLEVYFAGQVVTFNDAELCDRVYQQGKNGSAFNDWSSEDSPVVLTNACDQPKKQIAMVSGGSSQFIRLDLDSINNGAAVDLTGLEEFESLEELWLNHNSLTDLSSLKNAYQLRYLELNNNNLGSDDWSLITDSFTSLEILYLNNNPNMDLSEISTELSNLSNLGNLYLVNNGISDVTPLAYASSLSVLDLSENAGISDISGMVQEDSMCAPSILKIENAGIAKLPDADIIAEGFSNLTSLNLKGNQIADDTIANLASAPRLEELYLQDNQISSTAGFSEITTLKKLNLDDNQITDINGLTSLSKLTELHLANNQIDNLAGLEDLPALATLDLSSQTLADTITEAEAAYVLPAVFSQATTLDFPKVSGFQSAGDYTVTNGTIDYDDMTVIITDTSEAMTVTIPDGGLSGTKITITYTGGNAEFSEPLTDNTNGGVTIEPTSTNSFTVTSDKACMALYTQDNGTTWNRLIPSTILGHNNMREFNIGQLSGIEIVVAYAGDTNNDAKVNIKDARKIVNVIMGKDSMSSLSEKLADVNNDTKVNIKDARKIVKAIMGEEISW